MFLRNFCWLCLAQTVIPGLALVKVRTSGKCAKNLITSLDSKAVKQERCQQFFISRSEQGEHSMLRLRISTFRPRGAHCSTADGPNRTTLRTPVAAAICDIPLSLPR